MCVLWFECVVSHQSKMTHDCSKIFLEDIDKYILSWLVYLNHQGPTETDMQKLI